MRVTSGCYCYDNLLQGFSQTAQVFDEIRKAVQDAKVVFVSLDGDHYDATVRVSTQSRSTHACRMCLPTFRGNHECFRETASSVCVCECVVSVCVCLCVSASVIMCVYMYVADRGRVVLSLCH